jgi:hypothetical protein
MFKKNKEKSKYPIHDAGSRSKTYALGGLVTEAVDSAQKIRELQKQKAKESIKTKSQAKKDTDATIKSGQEEYVYKDPLFGYEFDPHAPDDESSKWWEFGPPNEDETVQSGSDSSIPSEFELNNNSGGIFDWRTGRMYKEGGEVFTFGEQGNITDIIKTVNENLREDKKKPLQKTEHQKKLDIRKKNMELRRENLRKREEDNRRRVKMSRGKKIRD